MSTYPTTIRTSASSRAFGSVAIWAGLAVALIGAVLVLVLADPDSKAPSRGEIVGARFQALANSGGAVSRVQADTAVTRFDGGPQEGTRGAVSPAPAVTASPIVRLAPLEPGTRTGIRGAVIPDSSSTRFDGGPNEGTRGR